MLDNKKLLAVITSVAVLVIAPIFAVSVASVNAHEGDETETGQTEDSPKTRMELRTKKQAVLESQQARKEEVRQRFCANRERVVNNIMDRIVNRAEKHIQLFDTVAQRVQNFYEDKGNTLANYEELVAAVDEGKQQAEASVEALKALEDFDCDKEKPKEDLLAFRQAHKNVIKELKEYRTSVKNLIVGVKSVFNTERDSTETETQ